eukprot:COSAG05_NODE_273_length_12440_cov_22.182805_9_plen_195_part_00
MESSLLDSAQLQRQPKPVVLWQRWWIVFVWAIFGVVGAFAWDMYAPISAPLTKLYGWDDDLINWLNNANNLAVVVAAPVWAWVVDTQGMRPAALMGGALFLCAMLLNIVPLAPCFPRNWSWLPVLSSEILNGVTSPLQMLAPPLISAAWFPECERTTATALMFESNILGISDRRLQRSNRGMCCRPAAVLIFGF